MAMAHTRRRRSGHDPGVVLAHLAVSLADGGDCLADIAVLRNQPDLFGTVASDPTVFRVLDAVHADGLRNIARARADARARAWVAGATPGEIVIDIDGTLVDAHSEKQDATPTYKRGFGFYPIVAYLDESGEALVGLLRPGRAGSNNAADHLEVLDRSLAQLPVASAAVDMLVRTDTAGATHDFVDGCRDRQVRFSIGLPVDQHVRDAFLLAQEEDWIPAVETYGTARDGAWVTELTDLVEHHWPEGTRVIARRERPHPGAQLTLFDTTEGFRHQVFITDQTETNIAMLELRHRHRAHVENRIRAAKDTGLRNLPCVDVVCNDAWLQLVLIAQDLHRVGADIVFSTVRCAARRGTETAATPRVPRRRPDRAHRRPDHRPVPTHLALGHRYRHRVHASTRRDPHLNARRAPPKTDAAFASRALNPLTRATRPQSPCQSYARCDPTHRRAPDRRPPPSRPPPTQPY